MSFGDFCLLAIAIAVVIIALIGPNILGYTP